MSGQTCEQFCSDPIGSDGSPGGEDSGACCYPCAVIVRWLCHDVLPTIRRYGYYSPPESGLDAEFTAMIRQRDLGPELRGLLSSLIPGDDRPPTT